MKKLVISADGSRRMKHLTMQQTLDRVLLPTQRLLADADHSYTLRTEDDDASITYFDDIMEKLKELNTTTAFTDFAREVDRMRGSLALLQHHHEKLLRVIIEEVRRPQSLALQAVLSATVQLARDLGVSFYSHFFELFEALTEILQTERRGQESVPAIDAVFNCITFLFKVLRDFLLPDLDVFYTQHYAKLLSREYSDHVRKMAADAYAFLLRSAGEEQQAAHVKTILEKTMEDECVVTATNVARIARGTISHAAKHLGSRHKMFLDLWFALLEKQTSFRDDNVFSAIAFVILRELVAQLATTLDKEGICVIVQYLSDHIEHYRKEVGKNPKSMTFSAAFVRSMHLLANLCSPHAEEGSHTRPQRRGTYDQITAILEAIVTFMSEGKDGDGALVYKRLASRVKEEMLLFIAAMLRHHRPLDGGESLLASVFAHIDTPALFRDFVQDIWSEYNLRAPATNHLLLAAHRLIKDVDKTAAAMHDVLALLWGLAHDGLPGANASAVRELSARLIGIFHKNVQYLQNKVVLPKLPGNQKKWTEATVTVASTISILKSFNMQTGIPEGFEQILAESVGVLKTACDKNGGMKREVPTLLLVSLSLAWEVLVSVKAALHEDSWFESQETVTFNQKLLVQYGHNLGILRACRACYEQLAQRGKHGMRTEELLELENTFISLLSNTVGQQRREALDIICMFDAPEWLSVADAQTELEQEALQFSKSKAKKHRSKLHKAMLEEMDQDGDDNNEDDQDDVSKHDTEASGQQQNQEEQEEQLQVSKEELVGPCDIMSLLQSAEHKPIDLDHHRDRRDDMRRATRLKYLSRCPPALLRLAVSYIVGIHHINFSLLWADARNTLATIARYRPQIVWEMFERKHQSLMDAGVAICGYIAQQIHEVAQATNHSIFVESLDALSFRFVVHPHEHIVPLPQLPNVYDGVVLATCEEICPRTRVDLIKLLDLFSELATNWIELTQQKHQTLVEKFLELHDLYLKIDEDTSKSQDISATHDALAGLSLPSGLDENEDEEETSSSSVKESSAKQTPARNAESGASKSSSTAGIVHTEHKAVRAQREAAAKLAPDDDNEADEDELTGPAAYRGQRAMMFRLLSRRNIVVQALMRTLLAIFAEFKNGKSLARHEELHKVFTSFLQHGNPVMRKSALHAVASFNSKVLKPYVASIETASEAWGPNLSEQLQTFKVADDVKPEHAEAVMEVLFRILLARMFGRKGRSHKYSAGHQRKLVLRYLADCKKDNGENPILDQFLLLLIRPFLSKQVTVSVTEKLDVAAVVDAISIPTDIHACVPLQKQMGFLTLVEDLVKVLAMHLRPYLPIIGTIVLRIAGATHQLLKQQAQVAPRHIFLLKTMRKITVKRMCLLYETYERNELQVFDDEIHSAMVQPQVATLRDECVSAVVPILKLFSTWSSDPELHSLFVHGQSIILTTIFGVLAHPSIAPPVEEEIIRMADNLLPTTDSTGPALIADHIPVLVSSLHALTIRQASEGKVPKFNTVKLSVLSRVAPYAQDAKISLQLLDLLLPYLRLPPKIVPVLKKRLILSTAQAVFLALKERTDLLLPLCRQHKNVIINLFGRLYNATARLTLCDVIAAMTEIQFYDSNNNFVQHVRDLNALASKKTAVGESEDIMARIQAMNSIQEDLKYYSVAQMEVILEAVGYMLFSENMTLQGQAEETIGVILEHFAEQTTNVDAINDLIEKRLVGILKRGVRSNQDATRVRTIGLIAKVVGLFSGRGILSDLAALGATDFFMLIKDVKRLDRIHGVQLLQEACASLNSQGTIAPGKKTGSRPDQMTTSSINQPRLKQDTITGFLVPLMAHFAFSATTDDFNLLSAAIDALGALAKLLHWQSYFKLLRRYLGLIPKRPAQFKMLIRIIVALLDAFHFETKSAADSKREEAENTSGSSNETALVHEQDEKDADKDNEAHDEGESADEGEENEENSDEEGVEDGKEEDDSHKSKKQRHQKAKNHGSAAADADYDDNDEEEEEEDAESFGHDDNDDAEIDNYDPVQVLRSLTIHILPRLERLLTYREDDRVKVQPISALALVKLVKLLPDETRKSFLPRTIGKVANVLQDRMDSVRLEARSTIVSIADALGPEFFDFILSALRTSLKRGYQLHVLGYTVHSVMERLVPQLVPGDMDDALEDLCAVFIDDIFGVVAEEKEAEELPKRIKEAKTIQSFDSFKLLARFISPTLSHQLLRPLQSLLAVTQRRKTVEKTQTVLQSICRGLIENNAAETRHLLAFACNVIREHHALTKSAAQVTEQKSVKRASSLIVQPLKRKQQKKVLTVYHSNAHAFVEFGLRLILTIRKARKLQLTELDVLRQNIGTLLRCLFSEYNATLTLAARLWSNLLVDAVFRALLDHHDSDSDKDRSRKTTDKLLERLLVLYSQTQNQRESSTFPAVCKATTSLLRHVNTISLAPKQALLLFESIRLGLDDGKQPLLLELLNAILHGTALSSGTVSQKRLKPLVERLQEVMVQSQIASARAQARTALSALLQQNLANMDAHVDFLVANLSYEYESGRLSVLEMIEKILCPENAERVLKHAEKLFLLLCTRLANADEIKDRQALRTMISRLIAIVDEATHSRLFAITEKWLSETQKQSIQQLVLHVISAFVNGLGHKFISFQPKVLPHLVNIVKTTEDAKVLIKDGQVEEIPGKVDNWFVLFQALTCLLEMCDNEPKTIQQLRDDEFWACTRHHLLFSHAWVRLAAGKLYSKYMETDAFNALSDERLLFVCKTFSMQLKSLNIGEEMAPVLKENLIKATTTFLRAASFDVIFQGAPMDQEETQTPSKKAKTQDEQSTELGDDDDEGEEVFGSTSGPKQRQRRPLTFYLLLTTITQMGMREALTDSTTQQEIVLAWYEAIAREVHAKLQEKSSTEVSDPVGVLLPQMARLIVRIQDHETSSPAMRRQTEELKAFLRTLVKPKQLGFILQEEQKKVIKKRANTKMEAQADMIRNPVVALRRKEKHRMKKQVARKRKVAAEKQARFGGQYIDPNRRKKSKPM
eukprot:m.23286 g.23286  ORF g.23286 m.23286 type:complete len:3006 (-) comp9475_c0_seq1:215-9232(-)